jgi:phage replication-related protein YjqB (UPF0714/DUF867 family)
VREVVELRSAFGFLAFHGGSLERRTEVIACEAARRAGASAYAVVQPPDLRWHLPSREVIPSESDGLARFLDHVDVAVAIHGYGRAGLWTTLLVGGTNRPLARHLATPLREALPDHDVVTDVDRIPPELRGLHPANPVNLPRAGGAQLELPPRVRGLTPHWAHWRGPALAPPTEALVAALAEAASTWVDDAHGARRSRSQPSSGRRV